MVIYTGKDTRMSMNSREARSKTGRLDNELNFLSKLLFLMMILISLILILLGGHSLQWSLLITFNRYIILISSVIPISMRVNLDFAKLIYCYRINIDSEIEGTQSRNSSIPEELGRI
jgi:phospholipid-translocating ATPase